MSYVFLSYSSGDWEPANRFVTALRGRGVEVWWDRERRGEVTGWSEDIDRHLNGAHRVVALVTPNVIASRRDNVYAEMDTALELRKLVPIQIGEFRLPQKFRSIMIGLNQRSYARFDQLLADDALDDLCLTFAPVSAGGPVEKDMAIPGPLAGGATVQRISLAVATAVFENMSVAAIVEAASKLESRVKELMGDGDVLPPDLFAPLRSRLQEIGAISFELMHPRLDVPVKNARFADPDAGFALFEYVWDEFDGLHDCLLKWLDELAASPSPDTRSAVGFMIGAMARTRFASILEHVVSPWMLSELRAAREVADLALRVAIDAPGIAEAIEKQLQDWVRGRSLPQIRAAIELACGYTGSRRPQLAIATLKVVAAQHSADLDAVEIMRDAIGFLATANRQAADGSLFDLAQLLHDLCEWAQAEDPHKPRRRLPFFLFLELMGQLPLRAPRAVPGVLSLEAVMANPAMARAAARMFNAALGDGRGDGFSSRDHARMALKELARRSEDLAKHDSLRNDPVLALAREIFTVSATERDRDRVAFAIRRFYSRTQIEAKMIGHQKGDGA